MQCAGCGIMADDNYLRRVDGRIKTAVFLCAIIVASVLDIWPLAAGVLAAAIALMFTLRIPARKVLWRMSAPFGVAWLVFASLIFTTGHTVEGTVNFRHVSLPVYREGMALGFLIMLRILASVSLAMLLSFSTPMSEILAALRAFRVPGLIVDIADMICRYAFSLGEIAATMRKAQLSRGGGGLPWHRQAGDLGRLAGNLMIKAFGRGERVYKAMLARGYDEEASSPPYYVSPIPRRDMAAGILAGFVLLSLLVCNFAVGHTPWN